MTSETPEPTYDYKKAKRRAAWIAGVRAMADFFERNPQLPHPENDTINIFADSREALAEFARVAGWTKEYSDSWFMLRRTFCDDLTLDINVDRSTVCRQVEVGEVLVEAKPAYVKKVYEWVCDDPALLGDPRRI